MPRMYIPGYDGSETPFAEIESTSQLSTSSMLILECDWSHTASDPYLLYNSPAGKLELYASGSSHTIKMTRNDQTEELIGTTYDYIAVCGYALKDPLQTVNRVLWFDTDSDGSHALDAFQNGSWSSFNELYSSYGALPWFVEEVATWDETPSTDQNDPMNLDPRGGEEADTMAFDTTDPQYTLPTPSAFDYDISSLCSLFILDKNNLTDLGTALFGTSFWTDLKNKFEGLSDPLSMILSVYQLPLMDVARTQTTFKLGGIELETSGGNAIQCRKATARYGYLDFGSISLKEVWGSAKDYTDCQVSIFLPFCGEKQLDSEIVVATTLHLHAFLDYWNGDVVYLLHVTGLASNKYFRNESVPYRWVGNCAKKLPIGRVDTNGAIMNLVSSGLSIAGGFAVSAITGNPAGLIAGASGAAGLLGSGMRPPVQSSGNVSGASGYMDYTYPYLMIKRGVPQYPNGWREQFGAPRYQTFLLSSLSGYTELSEIHVELADATAEENASIETTLRSGVIL